MSHVETTIINTTKQLGDLIDSLIAHHESRKPIETRIYVGLEGVDLCRNGSLSILTLLVDTGAPPSQVYLIDVYSLGSESFTTSGVKQITLKDILEDEKIPKVFFDVRNDSDTLFAHYGIALQGVEDIQLMESARRKTTKSRRCSNGLAKCVEQYALTGTDQINWKLAKKRGEILFKVEHGGSPEIFNRRPIPDNIVSYCIGDVQCLPKLWETFQRYNNNRWQDLINEETKKRVAESQRSNYLPHGRDKALAPWSQAQNKILDEVIRDLEDDWSDIEQTSIRDCITKASTGSIIPTEVC